MKIVKWLANSMSERLGYAIVEVEPNEPAVIEDFLKLIDGDSVGHYGIDVKLIGTGEFDPKWVRKNHKGVSYVSGQFGYNRATDLKQMTRFFEVMVHRD